MWQALRAIGLEMDKGKWIPEVVIDFPPTLAATKLFPKKLFVRTCYVDLFLLIEEILKTKDNSGDLSSAIVYGTPGIGKSFLGFFILVILAQRGASVVYEHGPTKTSYYFTPEEVREGDSDCFRREIKNPENYYVVDSFKAAVAGAKTILLTSPYKDHWKELNKESGTFLYMPPWSKAEMLKCHKLAYSDVAENVVIENFARWGGVARYVLKHATNESKQKELDDAISNCDPDMIRKSVGTEFAKEDITHRIVHIFPDSTYKKVIHDLASSYVRERVTLRLFQEFRRDLEIFLASSSGLRALGALRGYLFEDYAHLKLCAGGIFKIRKLGTNDVADLPIVKSEPKEYHNIEEAENPQPGFFYFPKVTNFESVDSYAHPNRLFQVTVAEKHSVKQVGLHRILEIMNPEWSQMSCAADPPMLFFVVPPERFLTFDCQPYHDMKGHVTMTLNVNVSRVVQYALQVVPSGQ